MVIWGMLHGSVLSVLGKAVDILMKAVIFLVVKTGKELKAFVVLTALLRK